MSHPEAAWEGGTLVFWASKTLSFSRNDWYGSLGFSALDLGEAWAACLKISAAPLNSAAVAKGLAESKSERRIALRILGLTPDLQLCSARNRKESMKNGFLPAMVGCSTLGRLSCLIPARSSNSGSERLRPQCVHRDTSILNPPSSPALFASRPSVKIPTSWLRFLLFRTCFL